MLLRYCFLWKGASCPIGVRVHPKIGILTEPGRERGRRSDHDVVMQRPPDELQKVLEPLEFRLRRTI